MPPLALRGHVRRAFGGSPFQFHHFFRRLMHFDPATAPSVVRTNARTPETPEPSHRDDWDSQPEHLVILVNGLFGSVRNWRAIDNAIRSRAKRESRRVLVHSTRANSYFQTFDGVDVCSERLASEVLAIVEANRSLKNISVIGHSLGGVLARHALSRLYREDGTIAGLTPLQYITLATPHVGVSPTSPSALPFLEWIGGREERLLGNRFQPVKKTLATISPYVGSLAIRRTGSQLFLTDTDGSAGRPLLIDMALNQRFLAPLKAFRRRVAYANVSGDHLVAWQGSALARMHESSPTEDDIFQTGRGVLLSRLEGDIEMSSERNGNTRQSIPEADSQHDELVSSLRSVGAWDRVDVCFPSSEKALELETYHATMPLVRLSIPLISSLTHNHIQVTHPVVNWRGLHVVEHLVENLNM